VNSLVDLNGANWQKTISLPIISHGTGCSERRGWQTLGRRGGRKSCRIGRGCFCPNPCASSGASPPASFSVEYLIQLRPEYRSGRRHPPSRAGEVEKRFFFFFTDIFIWHGLVRRSICPGSRGCDSASICSPRRAEDAPRNRRRTVFLLIFSWRLRRIRLTVISSEFDYWAQKPALASLIGRRRAIIMRRWRPVRGGDGGNVAPHRSGRAPRVDVRHHDFPARASGQK